MLTILTPMTLLWTKTPMIELWREGLFKVLVALPRPLKRYAPKWLQRIHHNGADEAIALNTNHRWSTSPWPVEFSTAPRYRPQPWA